MLFRSYPRGVFWDRLIKQQMDSLDSHQLEEINKLLSIPVFGMVKNDKHQTRALMNERREELEISQELMNLITEFQDTVHDTAITYHRKLRDKQISRSELDDIVGVGEAKKQALLKHFGSVDRIKAASVAELMEVKGISEDLAKRILGI